MLSLHSGAQDHADASNTTVGRWGYRAWDEHCQPDELVAHLAGGEGRAMKETSESGDGKLRVLLFGHRHVAARRVDCVSLAGHPWWWPDCRTGALLASC